MNSPGSLPITLTPDKIGTRSRKTSNFFPPSNDDSFSSSHSSNSVLDLGALDEKVDTFDFASSMSTSSKSKELLNPGFSFTRASQASSLSSASSSTYSTTKRHNSSPLIGSKFFQTSTNPPSTSSSSMSTPMLFPMPEFQPNYSQISMGYEEEPFRSPTMFHSPIQSIWSNNPATLTISSHLMPNVNDLTPKLNAFRFKTDLDLEQDLHQIEPETEQKKSYNIYSNRVNNPSFVPSASNIDARAYHGREHHNSIETGEYHSSIETGEYHSSTEPRKHHKERDFRNSITETRDYIKNSIPGSKGSFSEQSHVTNDAEVLSKKIEKIDRLMSISKKNISIKINLPRDYKCKEKLASPVNLNRILLDQICSTAVKYQEDYCSTFYKRNKHKYMFVKESSNSLKVNNSGGKSWVTVKLNLNPDQASKKKLKVDIKNLPVWKPINLNQSTNYDKPKGRSKRPDVKHNVSKRFGKK